MSATIEPSMPPSLGFKEVSRQVKSFQQVDSTRQQLLERLVQRLSELEKALQAANSDLEDQTSIRRQWKKRAEVAEASLAQNQFVVALIDGNRYTFADSYLKNTETGGEDAATDLVEQIRSYIEERGLHDDPAKVSVVVHIFANKSALSQALVDSGTISEPEQLDDFIAQFMRSRLFMYFLDCGSLEGAVDSKIQESYEYHFDNAPCKHLLLALRHESGYITELDLYREDESTLARTSLLRSSHAVVGKFASAFRIANTPALRTIALISLERVNATTVESIEESSPSVIRTRRPSRDRDLHSIFAVENPDSPVTGQGGLNAPTGIDPPALGFDSSTTSGTAAIAPIGNTTEPSQPIKSPPLTQGAQRLLSPKPTAAHTSKIASSQRPVHSYMNDWENAPSMDIYTPPPDHRPWGSEDAPSWDNASQSKSSNVHAANRANGSTSREATSRSSDASQKSSVSRSGHRDGGKRMTNSQTSGKARQDWGQSPVPLRSPREAPEFVPQNSRVTSAGLLQSKFSSPSKDINNLQPQTGGVAVNRHAQRIDLPLPQPSAEDKARLKSRVQVSRPCNTFHIWGECRVYHCKYDHDPIDEGMRLALVTGARLLPCKSGTGCRRLDCYLGHHCPYRFNPAGCTDKSCPFLARGMHDVDDLAVDTIVQPH